MQYHVALLLHCYKYDTLLRCCSTATLWRYCIDAAHIHCICCLLVWGHVSSISLHLLVSARVWQCYGFNNCLLTPGHLKMKSLVRYAQLSKLIWRNRCSAVPDYSCCSSPLKPSTFLELTHLPTPTAATSVCDSSSLS